MYVYIMLEYTDTHANILHEHMELWVHSIATCTWKDRGTRTKLHVYRDKHYQWAHKV